MNVRTRAWLGASLLTLMALAWAWPANASLAHVSAKTCHRYSSAGDFDARILARTAQTGAETIATDHHGVYTTVSPATLHALESSLPISYRQAHRAHASAYLLSASGTTNSYDLTARSLNGDTYAIHASSGIIERHARVCGKRRDW